MASQAHCNQMQFLQQGADYQEVVWNWPKNSNIGISGGFNAILRRFLWRLPRADNSYEKKRAILWGLPMNSMHRWCKRKRLKSGGGAAILCKEDSSSNIFRACTFGWLDSNQPKPTQHWTCIMILSGPAFGTQQNTQSKVPTIKFPNPYTYVWFWLDFWGTSATPILQPSYVFSFTFPQNWLDVVCCSGFPVLNDVHCNAALCNEDCSWLIFLRASTRAESKKSFEFGKIRNILHNIQKWKYLLDIKLLCMLFNSWFVPFFEMRFNFQI